MSEAHTACMASTLTEVKIKYVCSDNSATLRCLFWGGGGTPRFLQAFPFAIKACLSWEIQDRILLRERWKDRPSGASVGRAREGSGRSIERSSDQSVTGVNLELGEKKKKTMKATRCGGIWPHGPDVITGVSHMAPRCDDAPSAKMVFAGGGFLHQHGATCLSEMTFLQADSSGASRFGQPDRSGAACLQTDLSK